MFKVSIHADILEGSLQLHIKWLLKALIVDDKVFCFHTVNERIKSFCFGSDSTNKPTAIRLDTITSSGNTMKQSCKIVINLITYIVILLFQHHKHGV